MLIKDAARLIGIKSVYIHMLIRHNIFGVRTISGEANVSKSQVERWANENFGLIKKIKNKPIVYETCPMYKYLVEIGKICPEKYNETE